MIRNWTIWRADVSRWMLQIGIIGAALGIGYLVYGGLKGYFTNPIDPMRVSMVANTLAYFLYCCGWLVGLGLVGLFWEWRPIGITVFFSGVFVWFAMPFLFAAVAGSNTDLTMRGVDALRSFLTPMLIVGFVQSVWAFFEYWRSGSTWRFKFKSSGELVVNIKREQEKEKKTTRRPFLSPLSPCWKLPVIDKLMCEHCPVMKRRRPCWKLKMGCQCNPSIVDSVLASMAEKMGEAMWISSSPLLEWRKGYKPPCHRCTIYLQHQQVKYDWLAPIAFFSPPVLLFVGWEHYQALYNKAVNWLNQIWTQIAFTPPQNFDPLGLSDPTTAVYIAFVLAILAMVYFVRLAEFLIFQLML
ncbi:MAG: hypothetical protein NZ937_09280 [Armatimonadetes bacterium]|nr:hypothetical protein [Armatimonadota bacterium]MDW8030021.1 hypothetical protein [Armatimonadota bacterium]